MRLGTIEISTIAFHCPECGMTRTVWDDPEEYAYGHDCEDE